MFRAVLIATMWGLGSYGWAEAPSSLVLGTIDGEVDGDLTIVTTRLSQSPQWQNVTIEDHGTFLQVVLPSVNVPESGKFQDGVGPYIRKIASFQSGENAGAVRFFVTSDAAKLKLASSVEVLGDRVVFTLDHKKAAQVVTGENTQAPSPEKVAQQIVQSTKVEEESVTPAQVAKGEVPAAEVEQPADAKWGALHQRLSAVAAASLVIMAGLYVLAMVRRKRKLGRRMDVSSVDTIKLASLASLQLSTKQRIQVIQVGQEKLLLSVSDEHVSCLANLTERRHLVEAPSAFEKLVATPTENKEIQMAIPAPTVPRVGATTKMKLPPKQERPAAPATKTLSENNDTKGYEDITKMIRERLKQVT